MFPTVVQRPGSWGHEKASDGRCVEQIYTRLCQSGRPTVDHFVDQFLRDNLP